MYSSLAIAERYSKALFAASLEAEKLKEIEEDLTLLSNILSDEIILEFIKKSEQYSKYSVSLVDAMVTSDSYKFTAITKNLLNLLFENGRAGLLPEIIYGFFKIANKYENKEKVIVETAAPLDELGKAKFINKIVKDLGDNFYFEFKSNKDLIGGYRVIIRSKVLDASVKNRIDCLQRMIKV